MISGISGVCPVYTLAGISDIIMKTMRSGKTNDPEVAEGLKN